MTGWSTTHYDPNSDTSPTAPQSPIYRIGGYIISNTYAGSVTTDTIYLNSPAATSPLPEFLQPTPKEKRDTIRWCNKINFWNFLDALFQPKSTAKIKLPQSKDKRLYGTEDGLRPRPMLC